MEEETSHADPNGPPEAIIEAALDEFADRGFAGARIDEIARRAGVNKAGLYYHVGNKERLYLLSLRRLFTLMATVIADPLTGATPADRLREHITRFAEGLLADRRFAPIMLRELADHGANLPGEILSVMVSSLKRLSGIVEDGVAAGVFRPTPAPLLQFILVGSLNLSVVTVPVRARAESDGLVMAHQVSLPDPVELAGRLADLILNGLRADGKE